MKFVLSIPSTPKFLFEIGDIFIKLLFFALIEVIFLEFKLVVDS